MRPILDSIEIPWKGKDADTPSRRERREEQGESEGDKQSGAAKAMTTAVFRPINTFSRMKNTLSTRRIRSRTRSYSVGEDRDLDDKKVTSRGKGQDEHLART